MNVVPHATLNFSRLGGLVILGSVCLLGQICEGRQAMMNQPAGAESAQWIAGPAQADLGGIAKLATFRRVTGLWGGEGAPR